MSLVLDGGNGVTFPNGTNPQAAPSKVLQVVQGTTTSATNTSSSSFVTTTLTASITPLFSTSKILVIVSGGDIDTNGSTNECWATIYRNSTNIGNSGNGFNAWYNSSGRQISSISMIGFDSPATTSSTTYALYIKGNASVTYNSQIGLGSITLMEIAQ